MSAHPIWLLCESKDLSRTVSDALTEKRPFYWQGTDVKFLIALSDNRRFLTAADVGIIVVEVKTLSATPSESPLMRKTYGAFDCNPDFTGSAWGTGESLVEASFTAEEAALAKGLYRLVVRHEDPLGRKNTYLSATLEVVEDQSQSESIEAPPTPPVEYFTKAEANAAFVTPAAVAGAYETKADSAAKLATAIEKSESIPHIFLFCGDSTVAKDTGTKGAAEPGSVGPYYPYPGEENPENWSVMIRKRIERVAPTVWGNIAVGGRTLAQVDDAFDTEVLPFTPRPDQRAILTLVGGHNDLNLGRTVAEAYDSAVSIRTKAEALGFECVFVPCVWHQSFPALAIELNEVAVADRANWLAVIDQGYCAGGNFPWDTVHQTGLANRSLMNRWWTHVIEGEDMLNWTELFCGSEGHFITVQAAAHWAHRRMPVWPKAFVFRGKNYDPYLSPAAHFGDGRLATWGNPLRIRIEEGACMSILKSMNFEAGSSFAGLDGYANRPSSILIDGEGALYFSLYGERLATDNIPTRINPKYTDTENITNGGFIRASAMSIGGTWWLFDSEARGASQFSGTFYVDAGTNLTLLPGTTLIQSFDTAIFAIHDSAAQGILVGPGCTLITENGGTITNTHANNKGRFYFAGSSTVTNSAPSPGQAWTGVAPTVLSAGDRALLTAMTEKPLRPFP